MTDIVERLRQIENEHSECSILAGNAADVIEVERMKAADEIERLRGALTAILNDVGYRNPMRMTTEISDKVLFEAKAALDEKSL